MDALAATKTGRAGVAVGPSRETELVFFTSDVERINARVSAIPSERVALSDWIESLQAGSWRHELALNGVIGGVRLG